MIMPLEERFWSRVDKRGPDECWPWITNGKNNGRGYGTISWNGKSHRASRISWYLHHGEEIPKHLQACHHCDNPPCVNPAHLFVGTAKDNAIDARNKGRNGSDPGPNEQAIHDLLRAGFSRIEIAAKLGIGKSSVQFSANRFIASGGIVRPHRHYNFVGGICRAGHELTSENVKHVARPNRSPYIECLTCVRDRARNYWHKRNRSEALNSGGVK